ncbi:putative methylesterase 11, chloroplastic [Heracleum sosnowskyi]|uniref:Methylesterase 11, chloroplastic n=1 Tax=Heracleum sosnowskyi TaxID=360622 RepID=A0AAD8MRF0_9APIA|nr:putative methylesterase 11, chloroplastic [Heracleum sosnowskyi]
MGNSMTCFAPKERREKESKWSLNRLSFIGSSVQKNDTTPRPSSSSTADAVKKEVIDDDLLRQQAVAAVLLLKQHQQQNGSSVPQFDRSSSVHYPLSSSKKQNKLPRSSSTRPSSALDLSHTLLTKNQDLTTEEVLETKHFVLVHGGGFGAWCWYKSMALLREAGFDVDAVDLTGSGIDSTDSNSITSFAQYVKPLVDFIENLSEGQKVILVGHDFGGACVSNVMEMFPSKVSKAIYIAAAMLTSGKSTLSTYQEQPSSDVMQQAQKFIYANGKDHPPTSISLDKTLLTDLLYNESPAKDAILASMSMRPMPFAPIMHKLTLSEANYGSIQRFYIKTDEDFAVPVTLQEFMINSNPPEKVFQIKGSDHSPFLSKPQALHRILVEIAKLPSRANVS